MSTAFEEATPAGGSFCPLHMPGTGTVTGFAGNVDFRPAGFESILLQGIVFTNVGRVTLGAHVIPVVIEARPMQRIFVVHFLVGVKMKPTLATLLGCARVPTDAQRLVTSSGKLDQILLKWNGPKGVGDLILLKAHPPAHPSEQRTWCLA